MGRRKKTKTIEKLNPRINNWLLDYYYNTPLPKTRKNSVDEAVAVLNKTFGNMEKAMEALRKFQTNDPATKALRKVRQATQPLKDILEAERIKQQVINADGSVRKQSFRRSALSNAIAEALKNPKPGTKKEVKEETLADGRKKIHIRYTPPGETKDEYLIMDWMWENNIMDVFGIVKFYKNNKKRYKPKNWDDLCNVLRSLNFKPEEVLDYSISKIQTKEKFLKHRLYRPIENKETYALKTFIHIYKEHLKTKLPFKSFYNSDELKTWCASEDIHFKSEENCRVNKNLMVKSWNDLFPDDKIKDKGRK